MDLSGVTAKSLPMKRPPDLGNMSSLRWKLSEAVASLGNQRGQEPVCAITDINEKTAAFVSRTSYRREDTK